MKKTVQFLSMWLIGVFALSWVLGVTTTVLTAYLNRLWWPLLPAMNLWVAIGFWMIAVSMLTLAVRAAVAFRDWLG